MEVDLLLDHWYCIVKNTKEYQQVKLICDYYGRESELIDNFIVDKNIVICNGYHVLSFFADNFALFNDNFKKNFIEISLDYISNYDKELK